MNWRYRRRLFNHLGRLPKDLGRNRDAELVGRLQVDDQVELLPLDRNAQARYAAGENPLSA